MACWSFSLFVRLISERIARKRKRLSTQYSKRATWIALGLMVLCTGVSIACGYVALDLFYDFNRGSTPWINAATAIGWAVVGFGVLMMIWWAIGDRARGRVRCPKCWYDMSAAEGLQCPECGKTAKDKTKFGKARRARWMAVLALVFMGGGWYGVVAGPRVAETEEWLAAVPTWVLMAGWKVLPEEWIFKNPTINGPNYDSKLTNRFRESTDVNWSNEFQIRVFQKRVFHNIPRNQQSRWSPRRVSMINFLAERESGSYGSFFYQTPDSKIWENLDHNQITTNLHIYTSDLFEMLESPENNSEFQKILDTLVYPSWGSLTSGANNPQTVYERLSIFLDPTVEFDDAANHNEILQKELSLYKERFFSQAFLKNLSSNNNARLHLAFSLIYSANLEHMFLDEIFESSEGLNFQYLRSYARVIGYSPKVRYQTDKIDLLLQKCTEWIRSTDRGKNAIGLRLFTGIQSTHGLNSESDNLIYQNAYKAAFQVGHSTFYTSQTRATQFHGSFSQELILRHDTTHIQSFLMIRDFLTNSPDRALHLDHMVDLKDSETADVWLMIFSELDNSTNQSVRDWFSISTPPRYAVTDKTLWDEVALRFLDEDVRDSLINAARED